MSGTESYDAPASPNVWIQVLYHFGYPAAVSCGLAFVLWMVMSNVQMRLTEMNTTLQQRNAIFNEMLDNQRAILRQLTENADAYRTFQASTSKVNDQLVSDNTLILRRLDDLYNAQRTPHR